MKTDVLLFDLGGVLVEYTGVRDIAALLGAGSSEGEILARWSRCPHSRAYGLGTVDRQTFADRFVRDWGVTVSPERFVREFRSWTRRILPGAEDLLATVRPRYRLAALSNSNELHWERNVNDLGIDALFEMAISSHQVGLLKPDPAIYQVALDRLGVAAGAVAFFDDAPANVAAASALGMRAFQVEGVDAVRECLAREGLL